MHHAAETRRKRRLGDLGILDMVAQGERDEELVNVDGLGALFAAVATLRGREGALGVEPREVGAFTTCFDPGRRLDDEVLDAVALLQLLQLLLEHVHWHDGIAVDLAHTHLDRLVERLLQRLLEAELDHLPVLVRLVRGLEQRELVASGILEEVLAEDALLALGQRVVHLGVVADLAHRDGGGEEERHCDDALETLGQREAAVACLRKVALHDGDLDLLDAVACARERVPVSPVGAIAGLGVLADVGAIEDDVLGHREGRITSVPNDRRASNAIMSRRQRKASGRHQEKASRRRQGKASRRHQGKASGRHRGNASRRH